MSDHYDNTGLAGRTWFKPLVALWFGGLAAAGMGFMPPHVHGSLAALLGLAGLHPVFAPPVGREGVLALCAAAFVLGALIGLFIAWRIARASGPRAFAPGFEMHDDSAWQSEAEAEVFEEPRRRRVFSAREDIGEEGIAISAATGDQEYEAEYSIEDIPPATPEENFEAVYAELGEEYAVSGHEPQDTVSIEEPAAGRAFGEEASGDDGYAHEPDCAEEAEFEELIEAEADPQPETQPELKPETGPHHQGGHVGSEGFSDEPAEPEEASEALGDMSLEDLLGRLEGALRQHKKIVAGSEAAAQQPAPQRVPLTREPHAPVEPPPAAGLPGASEDDPVIAFLRREASRRMPPPPASGMDDEEAEETPAPQSQTEAQAALRSALDRLGQVGRRD